MSLLIVIVLISIGGLCVPSLLLDPDLSSQLSQAAIGLGIYCAIFGPVMAWIAWKDGIWR